jgi:hypothetical protein
MFFADRRRLLDQAFAIHTAALGARGAAESVKERLNEIERQT